MSAIESAGGARCSRHVPHERRRPPSAPGTASSGTLLDARMKPFFDDDLRGQHVTISAAPLNSPKR